MRNEWTGPFGCRGCSDGGKNGKGFEGLESEVRWDRPKIFKEECNGCYGLIHKSGSGRRNLEIERRKNRVSPVMM